MKKEMNNKEIVRQAIAKMSDAEKAKVFPPIERKNFVVRENWYGRNQVITFVNNKKQRVTYNHDEALKLMLPKLKLQACWQKRGYWSQSTDMPMIVRHSDAVLERETLEEAE